MHLSWLWDRQFGSQLWDPEQKKLIRSSDVVFNEDSTNSVRIGKRVNFDLSPADSGTKMSNAVPKAASELTRQSKRALAKKISSNLPIYRSEPALAQSNWSNTLEVRVYEELSLVKEFNGI